MSILGETLALSTAFCWAFGSILFSYAARRVGAFSVNAIRIPIAGIVLLALTIVIQQEFVTAAASRSQFGWLALSAFLGLIVGDGCHFRALVILGPRIATLQAASTAVFAVFFSWLLLGQNLGPIQLLGIAVTLGGLAWVTLERNSRTFGEEPGGSKVWGYTLAAIGAMGQATGLIAAKVGMQDTVTPLSAAAIRMLSASAMIWIIAVSQGQAKRTILSLSDRKAAMALLSAALIGPVFGIWMSLVSIRLTKIGIAATLMSTTPLWVIPLVMIVHKERPSARAIIGTIVTVVGVALLFLQE